MLLLPRFLTQLASAGVLLLVLVSAGQPLFAEDTWWHLSMGEVYAREGPWLSADPLLHTALGPPRPAAWLAGLAFHGVSRAGGFYGLRITHALLVAGILALAWGMLRRATGSSGFASLAAASLAALSAYRLFQLRPHLFTIFAALLLVWFLVASGHRPSWRRVAASTGLMALWANLHGAFVLGPILLAAGILGLLTEAIVVPAQRSRHLARAKRLAIALGLGLVATLANPEGIRPHLLYFVAGDESPALERVRDEWAGVHLFTVPATNLPPSPVSWGLLWILLIGTVLVAVFWLREVHGARRSELGAARPHRVDPALLGVAMASLFGALFAVRLLWLTFFPLLVLGQWLSRLPAAQSRRSLRVWGAAGAAVLLLPAFFWFGDWPMISRAVHPARYATPYPAAKFDAHAVWFLRDSGLEGRLFNDYSSGNFLGYWLTPRLQVFVNGSLNVPKELLDAHWAVIRRRGQREGESFEELLDRYGIDVFFGTGLPQVGAPGRPNLQTTAHLEQTPGWIPVFRNMRTAVYVRQVDVANLERVEAYYAREGVPFDRGRGFDLAQVVREAPQWAFQHGVVPADFLRVLGATRSLDPGRRAPAQHRLAAIYAAVGLYERAEAIDRRLLAAAGPAATAAGRRLVWSLLRQGRFSESLAVADKLATIAAAEDALAAHVVSAAREAAAQAEAGHEAKAAALAAVLPVFNAAEARRLLFGYHEPEPRAR